MSPTSPPDDKVTYTATNIDPSRFHRRFDDALAEVRAQAGLVLPSQIDGQPVAIARTEWLKRSPVDTDWVLGRVHCATLDDVNRAMRSAHAAFKPWAARPWRDRLAVLRRAASLIRERKYLLAAVMCVEVGKNRLEAMGDAEESADLIDYYAQQIEDQQGFTRTMASASATEHNSERLRPHGVFVCIAPFNFPLALSVGMSSAALMTGNTVVYKPSIETPWTGALLHTLYLEAGVPAEAFQLVQGHGAEIGDAMWQHPCVAAVVFTGSYAVGMRMFRGLAQQEWVKPCLMELGGKNATLVMESADLDAAAEGVMKSAFGLQGQKCSATSRVYVQRSVAEHFLALLKEKTEAITIGDVSQPDAWFGPVINTTAVHRWQSAVAQARTEGQVLCGGQRLAHGNFARGHFVPPTLALLPATSTLFDEELFAPFLAMAKVDDFDEALREANRSRYGLTAGIFSRNKDEIARFFDEIEAGVCFANKRSGATTGAWPGSQAFTGWKASGSSGKGGCGPWYVQQFVREQNRTVITPEPSNS